MGTTQVVAASCLLAGTLQAQLNANFSATPTLGPAPLEVQFTDQTSGGNEPYSYAWNFGDGSHGSGANPIHTYKEPGVFTVALSVCSPFVGSDVEVKFNFIAVNPADIDVPETITEIIDENGAGFGAPLYGGGSVATDAVPNVYVAGGFSSNVFRIEPDGTVTEIIDETGDGLGSYLDVPEGLAADAAGNVYVTGSFSNNA